MKKLISILLLSLVLISCTSQSYYGKRAKVLNKFVPGTDTFQTTVNKIDYVNGSTYVVIDTLGIEFKMLTVDNYLYRHAVNKIEFYFTNDLLFAVDFFPGDKDVLNKEANYLDRNFDMINNTFENGEWETPYLFVSLMMNKNEKEHLFYYSVPMKKYIYEKN